MMKLACLSTSYPRSFLSRFHNRPFRTGSVDLFDFIARSRALDLDGVDLHWASFASEERDYLREVKQRCLRAGLPIAGLGLSTNFTVPANEQRAQVTTTKRWIDHSVFLGAPQVRVFSGRPRDGDDRAAAWERCVASMQEVAEYGWEQGIQVAVQNHNHGSFTATGQDVIRLVEAVGPHLSHVWDTGQFVGSPGANIHLDGKLTMEGAAPGRDRPAREELYESLQQTVHLVTHMRAKIYWIETGEERWHDYARIFRILREAKYNGFCSLVYEGAEDSEPAIARAVTFLRRFVP